MQAKTSGKFSSEELDKLWRELQHHKEKVQEYHALLETLGGAEGAPCAVGAQTVPEQGGGGPHPQATRLLSRSGSGPIRCSEEQRRGAVINGLLHWTASRGAATTSIPAEKGQPGRPCNSHSPPETQEEGWLGPGSGWQLPP